MKLQLKKEYKYKRVLFIFLRKKIKQIWSGQQKYININNKTKNFKSFAWSLNSAHHFKHISNLSSCAFVCNLKVFFPH